MKYIDQEHYVDQAEKVIQSLTGKKNKWGKQVTMLTTSQIRNLLSMTADIYNDVVNRQEEKLSADVISRIEYLRVHFVYESGRDQKVKDFVQEAHIIEILKSMDKTRADFILFNRYMEALVAFHRYYGGKDM